MWGRNRIWVLGHHYCHGPVRSYHSSSILRRNHSSPRAAAAAAAPAPPTPNLISRGEEQAEKYKNKKRLDVAIVGLPNAGKSQLLNRLTETTVAAVSRKRHTTREGILGARTVVADSSSASSSPSATQLLFVDTPGFLRQGTRQEGLNRDIEMTPAQHQQHVDYSLVVVDAARRLTEQVKESLVELMLQSLKSQGRYQNDDEELAKSTKLSRKQQFAVVLNKVDLVSPKSDLLDIAMEIGSLAEECILYQQKENGVIQDAPEEEEPVVPHEVMPTFFYISALKNDGVDDLLKFLLEKATPCEEWDVDPGATTSMTPEERVEEVIREKIYRCLHKEVPYNLRQKNRLFRVIRNPSTDQLSLVVHQDLMVRTKSHKQLVHGTGNRTLERIRETAVRDLQKILGCPVDLHLHVKLVKSKQRNWSI